VTSARFFCAPTDEKRLGYAKVTSDVAFLRGVLAEVLKSQDPELQKIVMKLRTTAREWRDPLSTKAVYEDAFKALCSDVECLPPENLRDVARAFSHLLALYNVAENHMQYRNIRNMSPQSPSNSMVDAMEMQEFEEHALPTSAADALPTKTDSCAGTMDVILSQDGASLDEMFEALTKQQVEIVFTAHPTEVNKEELLTKHRQISDLLVRRDEIQEDIHATSYDRTQNERAIRRTISGMWDSDVLRRKKPTPQEEARDGLSVLRTSLWDALPNFLRRLDAVTAAKCGERLPLQATPVIFSSWMGGDRDGNPNVTSSTTREVVLAQRRMAALLYLKELNTLKLDLSVHRCTDEVAKLAGGASTEPYKAILSDLIKRMQDTVRWADLELQRLGSVSDLNPGEIYADPTRQSGKPIFKVQELAHPLEVMHASLVATGHEELADGSLTDLIRRVAAFGLQLRLPLVLPSCCELTGPHLLALAARFLADAVF